jgi:hypothetical protein
VQANETFIKPCFTKKGPKCGKNFFLLNFGAWSQLWEDGTASFDIVVEHGQCLPFGK